MFVCYLFRLVYIFLGDFVFIKMSVPVGKGSLCDLIKSLEFKSWFVSMFLSMWNFLLYINVAWTRSHQDRHDMINS